MTRALCAAVLAAVVACGSDAAPSAVAELVAANGAVESSVRAKPDAWQASALGARFRTGDGVRTGTGPDASARVRMLRGNGVLRMGPASLVRFGAEVAGARGLTLETGEATIEAGDAELAIDTAGGRTRVRRGTVVRVRKAGGRTQLEVVVGEALIERTGAAAMVVTSGETADVSESGEVTRAARPAGDAGVADAGVPDAGVPPDAGVLDTGLATLAAPLRLGKREVDLQPRPAKVSGALPAGEQAAVHAPSVPTHMRIEVGDTCPADAVVEVRNGRRRRYFRGRHAVDVALTAGRNRYRVLCNEGGTLRTGDVAGAVRVVRDSGRRKVKTRAPRNEIEADGRKYTLLYQNRKPTIELVWPRAPAASRYEVVVTSAAGKARTFKSTKPRYSVRSGVLPEGKYSWRFRTADGAAQSVESRLVLDFDNASPAVQIDSVKWTAAGVEVRGLATEGSKVTVGGAPVAVDEDYRFVAKARVPANASGIAIRIVRPGGDVHYYEVRAPRKR